LDVSTEATSGPTSTVSCTPRAEESGEVYWLILPTLNTELFSMALNEFAKEVAVGKDKRAYFWWWIRPGGILAKRFEVPEGIHLEFLPSGSPELQPVERLWVR
jgi:hypothetical protein